MLNALNGTTNYIMTNMFNGISHPAIALLHADGAIEIYKVFRYEDYRDRMC